MTAAQSTVGYRSWHLDTPDKLLGAFASAMQEERQEPVGETLQCYLLAVVAVSKVLGDV